MVGPPFKSNVKQGARGHKRARFGKVSASARRTGILPLGSSRKRDVALISAFLGENGRLPDFAQQRLDSLIHKRKATGLSAEEEKELSAMLDYVDDKTIELLGYFVAVTDRPNQRSNAARPPTWASYIDQRLKRLQTN